MFVHNGVPLVYAHTEAAHRGVCAQGEGIRSVKAGGYRRWFHNCRRYTGMSEGGEKLVCRLRKDSSRVVLAIT